MHPAWSRCSPLPIFPVHNDCGPIIHDDPILADGLVQFVGQPIFAVVAESYTAARKAARLADIDYEILPAVLDVASGRQQESYVIPPMQLRRGDAERALESAPRRIRVRFRSVGRSSFTLKDRSPMSHRKKMAAFTCGVRPSIRARCSRSSRMRSVSISTR